MNIANILCVTGAVSALYTLYKMPYFLSRGDTDLATGMFFSGAFITIVQLVVFACSR